MATAIEFENVGKQYRLGLVSTQTLSHDLHRSWWFDIKVLWMTFRSIVFGKKL